MSELVTNKITPSTGSSDTVTLGDSSDTFQVPSGVTLNVASGATISNSGTATGFGVTLGTPVATTSGTSHTFTGIPSGTKRITINFYRADTNGTEASIVQLGDAGGFETSGYIGSKHRSDTGGDAAVTTGMAMMTTINDALTTSGSMVLSLVDASTFSWVSTCMLGRPDGYLYSGGSSKSLSAELTQIKLLQESGSSSYDGGKMNIIYE